METEQELGLTGLKVPQAMIRWYRICKLSLVTKGSLPVTRKKKLRVMAWGGVVRFLWVVGILSSGERDDDGNENDRKQ